jgi:hypothetical protein
MKKGPAIAVVVGVAVVTVFAYVVDRGVVMAGDAERVANARPPHKVT